MEFMIQVQEIEVKNLTTHKKKITAKFALKNSSFFFSLTAICWAEALFGCGRLFGSTQSTFYNFEILCLILSLFRETEYFI